LGGAVMSIYGGNNEVTINIVKSTTALIFMGIIHHFPIRIDNLWPEIINVSHDNLTGKIYLVIVANEVAHTLKLGLACILNSAPHSIIHGRSLLF
jgi:hypothetical protein